MIWGGVFMFKQWTNRKRIRTNKNRIEPRNTWNEHRERTLWGSTWSIWTLKCLMVGLSVCKVLQGVQKELVNEKCGIDFWRKRNHKIFFPLWTENRIREKSSIRFLQSQSVFFCVYTLENRFWWRLNKADSFTVTVWFQIRN